MGHRALVAYERPDNTYNLHYSHWGASDFRLAHDLTPTTPFGGHHQGKEWPRAVYEQLQIASSACDYPHPSQKDLEVDVDPEPVAVCVGFDAILEQYLDYLLHEALYVVSESFDVTAYRTFWIGFAHDVRGFDQGPTTGSGMIATVQWVDGKPVGDSYRRGWFDGAKSVLTERIQRGTLTESEATQRLIDLVRDQLPCQEEGEIRIVVE